MLKRDPILQNEQFDADSNSIQSQDPASQSLYNSTPPPPYKRRSVCLPTRYVMALWASAGFVIVYVLRVNLSVALVSMVNSTALHEDTKNYTGSECPELGSNSTHAGAKDGKFVWDKTIQGYILGAFFWGYIPFQIPAGYISQIYGGKWLFGFGVLWTAVLTLLTPLAAEFGYEWLIALRVLEGIGESITYPAMNSILGNWVPPMESSFLSAIAYSGGFLGLVVGTFASGYLIDSGFLGGWPSTFYVPGAIGILWFICWAIFAYSRPSLHPRIDEDEKMFIEESIGVSTEHKDNIHTPWKEIAMSMPVWAITVAGFANLWSIYTLLTCLPQYFNDILRFSIDQNGLVSAMPYIVMWITFLIACRSADFVRNRELLSTQTTRKLFNTFGLFGQAAFLIGTGFAGCERAPAVLMLCAGAMMGNLPSAGYAVNHIDLAPQFAGILYGVTNSIASASGILGPLVVGYLTTFDQTRKQWQLIFIISAAINVFGGIFYLIFGSGKRQNWVSDSGETDPLIHSAHY